MHKMKKIIGYIFLSVVFILMTLYALTYKGEQRFSELKKLPDVNLVVEKARSLSLVPYDPLMGKHENIGGRLGFIVCSDVPNIAYGLAGYSLEMLFRKSFKKNPGFYDSSNYNNPRNPFFIDVPGICIPILNLFSVLCLFHISQAPVTWCFIERIRVDILRMLLLLQRRMKMVIGSWNLRQKQSLLKKWIWRRQWGVAGF
jgi:hypothetical protein